MTGQSLATETWKDGSALHVVAINNNFEGKRWQDRLRLSLRLPFRVRRESLRTHPVAMYLSLKRSLLGLLTDLAAVLAYRTIVRGPVVVHLHGADLDSALNSIIARQAARLLWRSVTDVIVLSPLMGEQLRRLPERRVHVVTNFAEKFATPQAVAEKANSTGRRPLHVVFLSNIMFSKGFKYLVEAVRNLQSAGEDIQLTLAGRPMGDPWMRPDEALECLTGGLTSEIRFVGSVSGQQKSDLLAAADVIALPTFYPTEAQPISLIEGMAFGAVPLTTRHNYNQDFLDPRAAVFVKTRSTDSIAEALRMLASDPTATGERMKFAFAAAKVNHEATRFVEAIDQVVRRTVIEANDHVCVRHSDGQV